MRQKELVRELQCQTNKITDLKFKMELEQADVLPHLLFYFCSLVEINFLDQFLDFTHDCRICLNCIYKKNIGFGVIINRKIQAQSSSVLIAKAKV